MTKDLYYTIPQFFIDRMQKHSKVRSIEDVSTEEHFLYRISRERFSDVLVWLSDAYRFTDMDYINRPAELGEGDYIVIAKPEGSGGASSEQIADVKIGVGKLADIMGALNVRDMWKYVAPSWKEKEERRKRFESRRPIR